MKFKYDNKGRKVEAILTKAEKHKLVRKNLKMLRQQGYIK